MIVRQFRSHLEWGINWAVYHNHNMRPLNLFTFIHEHSHFLETSIENAISGQFLLNEEHH